jgi:hypothetical protein
MNKSSCHGKYGWYVENETIRCFLTETGGHMAPVVFFHNTKKPVEPYYISPWQDEEAQPDIPVLKPLRGNFFCVPFGGDNVYKDEDHPANGESSTEIWRSPKVVADDRRACLSVYMDTRARPGRITKEVFLVEGQSVVYQRHVLKGYSGPFPLGYHATLAPPGKGHLKIGYSTIRFGMNAPRDEVAAAGGEYFALEPLARFDMLEKVPTIWRNDPYTDCTVFPAREGFVDILQVYQDQKGQKGIPAWITATAAEDGYLWFALKNAKILNSTVIWMENHGRHQFPWNGRNCCIGLEDVCSFFVSGLKLSARNNLLNKIGIPTVIELSADHPLAVPYIEGVVKIPKDYGQAVSARFPRNQVVFTDENGKEVGVEVFWGFLFGKEL